METKTFTFHEFENGKFSFSEKVKIHYCSYCGSKAISKDIGCSYNHRWEEEIIYYCNCENAEKEKELRKQLSEHKSKIYQLERELSEMDKLADNSVTNKMKYDNEVKQLQKKYKI